MSSAQYNWAIPFNEHPVGWRANRFLTCIALPSVLEFVSSFKLRPYLIRWTVVFGQVGMLEGFSSCGSSGGVHTQQLVEQLNGLGIGSGKELSEVLPRVVCQRSQVLLGLGRRHPSPWQHYEGACHCIFCLVTYSHMYQ